MNRRHLGSCGATVVHHQLRETVICATAISGHELARLGPKQVVADFVENEADVAAIIAARADDRRSFDGRLLCTFSGRHSRFLDAVIR